MARARMPAGTRPRSGLKEPARGKSGLKSKGIKRPSQKAPGNSGRLQSLNRHHRGGNGRCILVCCWYGDGDACALAPEKNTKAAFGLVL
jgi:hypothetical protein